MSDDDISNSIAAPATEDAIDSAQKQVACTMVHAGDGEGKHEHERECARRDQILYSAPTLPSSPRELPTGVAGALATQAGFIDA